MKRTPIKKPPEKNNPGQEASAKDTGTINACAVGLILISAAQLVLYSFTGFFPLYLAGLVQLLPALIQLILLIPVPGKEKLVKAEATYASEKKLSAWLLLKRSRVVAVLIGAVILIMQLLYWTAAPNIWTVKLSYPVLVFLAVLFVVAMMLDRWCKYSADKDNTYNSAVLQNLRSALALTRMILLLLIVAVMLHLLGLYDASSVMRWIIGILFVYSSVFLVFSLVARLVRRELDTAPKFVVVMPGVGSSDLSFLPYLEENTGITMRSLWSIRMIKQMVPIAIVCVVALVWLSTGVVQIESYQEGALYRFGRLQKDALKPGIHLTLPWPFDTVEVYDTQSIGTVTIGYVPTGDQDNFWTQSHGTSEYRLLLGGGDEMVSINLRVEYKISDLYSYVTCASAPESLLEAECYEIVTARTISTDLDTLLSTDREAFSHSFREELMAHMAGYNSGIEVVNVNLESIHPPIEVAGVYQDIISAGIEAERMILAAQTEANTKIMNAEKEYATAVGAALVTQYESVAAAEAAVAEFMASVAADGSYRSEYRYYKYMDALTKAYSGAQLILVGEGVDTANLFIGSLNLIDAADTETPVE